MLTLRSTLLLIIFLGADPWSRSGGVFVGEGLGRSRAPPPILLWGTPGGVRGEKEWFYVCVDLFTSLLCLFCCCVFFTSIVGVYKVLLRTKGGARLMLLHFAPQCALLHPYGRAWSYTAV